MPQPTSPEPSQAEWRSLLEKNAEKMLALSSEGDAIQYEIGVLYNTVVEQELAEKSGYRTAQVYLAEKFKGKAALSQASLTRCGRVAKAFSKEITAKYGITDLYALLGYAAVAHIPVPNDPGDVVIQVIKKDGAPDPKPFARCTRGEVASALRHLKKPDASLLTEEQELAKRFNEILDHLC